MGYAALYLPDHFGEQPGPVAALMSAADATTRLRIGSLVFDNDYRHPVVLAKEAATLDLLSAGRLDLGNRGRLDGLRLPAGGNSLRLRRHAD